MAESPRAAEIRELFAERNWEPPARAKLDHAPDRCPNATLWKVSCKRRSCAFCGPRWARDWRRVLAVNLEALGGPVATIAITGPGADVLPWDDDYCRRRGAKPGHTHSGKRGCRVRQGPLDDWCDALSWKWTRLREAARIATKRELDAAPPWILSRVWEPQKRGVPHLHLVVPYGSFAERHAADVFRKHLARLAPSYSFGRVQPKLQPIQGREAARYLANYLAGRTAKKDSIRNNISDPRIPRSLLWLTPRLTRETLVTMRTLRRARHLWAHFDGRCDPPIFGGYEEAAVVAVVFRSIYPARAGPLGEHVDVHALRSWGARIDGMEQRGHLVPLFYETEKLLARTADLGKWAFQSTAALPAAA